jgi:transcriptional regulator with XRE-family HTH domain/mannose-6-phosphate isomerase-like protein (cupin superfamily)
MTSDSEWGTEEKGQRERRRMRATSAARLPVASLQPVVQEIDVGQQLRNLRMARGFSMRALAEMSGLNLNTLSLIENGKSSPGVSTLQQLAVALQVPITAFFEVDTPQEVVVFQKAGQRARVHFSHGVLEDLGAGLTLHGGQPLKVVLQPDADSGADAIVHTGIEFVYCLKGHLCYSVEDRQYCLEPGDSLMFEAHLPHRWRNIANASTEWLLIICPADERDRPTERHFTKDSG